MTKMKSQDKKKAKVFVGVSGGVDSSVALALLKKDGYDVTGVFLKVWHPDFLPCDWKEERRSAMRVCATLGVPFLTLDCEKEYKKEVVDYMIAEYRAGRTPNPDVFCNKYVKFGVFLQKALELGADFVATGHYAISALRKSCMQENLGEANDFLQAKSKKLFELHEGIDGNKDQSYFLYTLNQEQLSRALFPVGDLTKPEVRKLAKKFGLPTATKKDSQGVCFLENLDIKDFLSHYIETKKGDVLNTNGETVGWHDGAVLYTIGERHGFTMTKKSSNEPRYFVVAKDLTKNTITVAKGVKANTYASGKGAGDTYPDANKISENDSVFSAKEIIVKNLHLISDYKVEPCKCLIRIRYRQEKQKCAVTKKSDGWHIVFDKPQNGVALGQSAVLYIDTLCLGGGIIDDVR